MYSVPVASVGRHALSKGRASYVTQQRLRGRSREIVNIILPSAGQIDVLSLYYRNSHR
jgi:hypothetical protein